VKHWYVSNTMQDIKSIRMNLYIHFYDNINTPHNTDLTYTAAEA